LYREYRDVVGMFRFVIETERRSYLANKISKLSSADDDFVEYELIDAWVWDVYRQSRFVAKVNITTTKGITIEELPEREL